MPTKETGSAQRLKKGERVTTNLFTLRTSGQPPRGTVLSRSRRHPDLLTVEWDNGDTGVASERDLTKIARARERTKSKNKVALCAMCKHKRHAPGECTHFGDRGWCSC